MRHSVSSFIAGLSLWTLVQRAAAQPAASADEVHQLEQRLAQVQQRADLVPWLALAIGLLALAVALLAWQLWRRRDPATPARPAEPATAPDHPAAEPEAAAAAAPTTTTTTTTTTASAALPEPMSVTIVQSPGVTPAHGQSIEEHIDVDQQAQFLVVLGQDEAAIDLLLDHLRGTGGTSPLPYLRLMQIYRARGDEAAYERTRQRFNLRFNAMAPEWQADPAGQQALEAYPAALQEVQRAWASPLDAMAVIESLLFRRGSEDERFDLPAYEELLFLYWLTRELQQAADNPPSQVDVLLPLDDQAAEVSVIERPWTPLRVDLDLSTVPGPADEDVGR
jgi:hypothetical protein